MLESQPTSRMARSRIMAAIPAYNVEQFIANVVSEASKFADEVIVVNDGSTDNTAQIARAAGALVFNHNTNKGYGESIKSCFKAAKTDNPNILVILDGDGQHDPDDIPRLLAPIIHGKADVVIGSRLLDNKGNMPRYRRFGIKLITFIYNLGSKLKISDAQSGFRAYSNEALNLLNITESGMGASVEIISQLREAGFRIEDVPVSCIYHPGSHSIHPITHGLGVILFLLTIRIKGIFH